MDLFLQPTGLTAPTEFSSVRTNKIHVRAQQMGRKWITTIAELDDDLDLKRIARALAREFHCSAAVVKDETTGGEVIKLSGHQVTEVRGWLLREEILTEKEAEERLVLHGAL
jgi:translation initiation factor SUI1